MRRAALDGVVGPTQGRFIVVCRRAGVALEGGSSGEGAHLKCVANDVNAVGWRVLVVKSAVPTPDWPRNVELVPPVTDPCAHNMRVVSIPERGRFIR